MAVYHVTSVFFGLLLLLFLQTKAEWNTKDYMKREHSLIKPYQGEV
jgi:mannose-binding lectin 2